MKENISHILQSLEPSSELKRRVMERAEKLEAGRKTFDYEKTTADNIQTNKEQIKMNASNTNDIIKVKRNSRLISISAAACAAVIIGIGAINLNSKEPKPLPTTENQYTTTDEQNVIIDDDSTTETLMTVTEQDGSTYTITDKDRIAAIDALVEKAKQSHVWEGEKVPAERTLEYTIDGKDRVVEISDYQLCQQDHHPDSKPHPEMCRIVTVDGASYTLCELTPDEPMAELCIMTDRSGDLSVQRYIDGPLTVSLPEEYQNETAARKLRDIIEDVRANGTPQFETEGIMGYWEDYDELPSWESIRADCSFGLDGNYYNVDLYGDNEFIFIKVYDWHDGKTRYLLYNDTQNWTAEFNDVFDSLKIETNTPDTQKETVEVSNSKKEADKANDSQEETVTTNSTQKETTDTTNTQIEADNTTNTQKETVETAEPKKETAETDNSKKEDTSEAPDTQEDEPSDETVSLPELFDLTEEEAVKALKEAGLNCLIDYTFDSTEKGMVCSYNAEYDDDCWPKGAYVSMGISLGEYDGPNEMLGLEYGTGYYPTKESKLEVPLPDGMRGSYTFNIYFSGYEEYTVTVDDISSVKSVTFDMSEPDKMRRVVYAKNNNSKREKLIRYATYEFDYEAETWTLIGELNTDELLASMN